MVIFWVATAMVVVLVLLGSWQRRISLQERDRAVAELILAQEAGTDRPLAQFPTIDVQRCIGCATCVRACPEDDVLRLVDGVARVVHGANCLGHALCEEACPIGAIHVGLDTSLRPDLPLLAEDFETSVPGLYVAGELGGFALIRVAAQQGVQVVDAIARTLVELPVPHDSVLDLLVIGAGPAGIAASLRAKELGLHFLTVDRDSIGGTITKYPRRKLTLTGPMTLPLHGVVEPQEFLKEELIEFFETLIEREDLPIRTGTEVTSVQRDGDAFLVETSDGSVRATCVVLALGRRGTPRRLEVPGEEQEKVQYQLVDAAEVVDEHVLVVGGGDSALEAAMALAEQPGNVVTLAHRGERFSRARRRNLERLERMRDRIDVRFLTQVVRIDDDAVVLTEGPEHLESRIPNHSVYVCAGGEPPHAFLSRCGVKMGGVEAEPAREPTLEEVLGVTVP